MATYIGLLRAVNVAGHNKVAMAALRELLVGLGMREVRSLLQSGNLVFESDLGTTERLERILEDAAERELKLRTRFFLRTRDEWNRVVADNPFREEARRDPSRLLVMFLKQAPDRTRVAALEQAIKGREIIGTKGRQAYIVYPDGIGRSRLTGRLIETKLGTPGTARNWNTVLKLEATATAS